MRLDLRLKGKTGDGRSCVAVLSVYATGPTDLQTQADTAARTAVWEFADPPHESVPEGSHIIVEGVERI